MDDASVGRRLAHDGFGNPSRYRRAECNTRGSGAG